MDKKKIKYLSEHPIIAEVVSGTILLIIGLFIGASNNPVIEHYFAADTASTFIDAYLVETGYVDESILEIESLDQQFQIIHDSFSQYEKTIETALIKMGQDPEEISQMEQAVLLPKLTDLAVEMTDSCSDKDTQIEQHNNRINELEAEIKSLEEQIVDYEQRKEAELLASHLIINGELMNNGDSINNAVVKVDGNNYCSESLLNAHILEDQISQDTANNTIVVGNAKPEKVKFSWDIVTNSDGVGVYEPGGGETFVMDTKSYSEGLVLTGSDYFYAYLGGKYSKLSFTYGHVDNTYLYDLELTIYALDENNKEYTVLKTIPLKPTLACSDIEIPLSYATKIKIAMSGWSNYDSHYSTQYGLTDIYFYS